MKSEPAECSIDDLAAAPRATVPWVGVRNYQARNFMRDAMQVGDGVLFYHSSCAEPGVAGLARVASAAYPDPTQFDPASPYFDPKSTRELRAGCWWTWRWCRRQRPELATMGLLQRGSRLSITPVRPSAAPSWQAPQGCRLAPERPDSYIELIALTDHSTLGNGRFDSVF
jgi:predicted RNA-binding protein with PUA-like domain